MSELLTSLVTLIIGAVLPLSYLLFGSQRRLRQLERLTALHNLLPASEKKNLEAAIGKLASRVNEDAERTEKQSDWIDYAIAVLVAVLLAAISIVILCAYEPPTSTFAVIALLISGAMIVFLIGYAVRNWRAMSRKQDDAKDPAPTHQEQKSVTDPKGTPHAQKNVQIPNDTPGGQDGDTNNS